MGFWTWRPSGQPVLRTPNRAALALDAGRDRRHADDVSAAASGAPKPAALISFDRAARGVRARRVRDKSSTGAAGSAAFSCSIAVPSRRGLSDPPLPYRGGAPPGAMGRSRAGRPQRPDRDRRNPQRLTEWWVRFPASAIRGAAEPVWRGSVGSLDCMLPMVELADEINGRVIAPDDADYDEARSRLLRQHRPPAAADRPRRGRGRRRARHRARARDRAGARRPQRRPQPRRPRRLRRRDRARPLGHARAGDRCRRPHRLGRDRADRRRLHRRGGSARPGHRVRRHRLGRDRRASRWAAASATWSASTA